jgi:hypothetical protein
MVAKRRFVWRAASGRIHEEDVTVYAGSAGCLELDSGNTRAPG